MAASEPALHNRVQQLRQQRGLSQQQLAAAAGISRSGVSAIEGGRLWPSIGAALALARALSCGVEELFVLAAAAAPRWCGTPAGDAAFWQAEVAGSHWRYPVERTLIGQLPHDGRGNRDAVTAPPTVVLASCDPAAGVLAALLQKDAGLRLLPLSRGSHAALRLLQQGAVHFAAVHLGDNLAAVRRELGKGHALVHVARWQEGLALPPGKPRRSVRGAVRQSRRWAGREVGSGARLCLDRLLQEYAVTARRPHVLADHFAVAAAVQGGFADAGVCVQLAAAQAGLSFLPVATETLELCTRNDWLDAPAVQAVVAALRSAEFRRQLDGLPGYDARGAGAVRKV